NFILDNRSVPQHDLISYIQFPADHIWVAYEWLSDALMAALVRIGGLNLLAVFVSCGLGWLFVLIYDRCRKEGSHFLTAAFLVIIGALTSALHWLARPHIFTFFGVFIFTTKLEDYYRGTISNTRLLLWLAATMIVWVNCHPAFLLGYALIGIYIVGTLMTAFYCQAGEIRQKYLARAKHMCLCLGAVIVASFVNPYGPKLFQYIFEYLKGNFILNATDEFASPVFHGSIHSFFWEVLLFMFIVALSVSAKRLSPPQMLCCLAFIFLSLSAVRNIPLFVIMFLPAIALLSSKLQILRGSSHPDSQLTEANRDQIRESTWWQNLVAKWHRVGDMCDDMEWQCKMHLLPLLLLIGCSVMAIFHIGGKDGLNCVFNPDNMPVETLSFLKQNEDSGKLHFDRGFNFDNWGGYIRYVLGTRVFIDDRADFYGPARYMQYSNVSLVSPGWQKVLNDNKIEWIIFPNDSRLVAALKESSDWKLLKKDKAASLFARTGVDLPGEP
ncbi:MAG TPA: hypothetical protein V6C72_15155, partial [Chroococcales cyanobacterium]